MPFALVFFQYFALEVANTSVWPMFLSCDMPRVLVTSRTLDGVREKTDMPFILIFTAHLGFVRYTICAGFLQYILDL